MKRKSTPFPKIFLFALGLGASTTDQAAFTLVAVTGYNADVVANGAGTVIASTTDDVDGGAVGNRFNFMAPTFIGSTGVAPTTFLPASGLITSATTSGLTFHLPPYTTTNSLRINGSGAAP